MEHRHHRDQVVGTVELVELLVTHGGSVEAGAACRGSDAHLRVGVRPVHGVEPLGELCQEPALPASDIERARPSYREPPENPRVEVIVVAPGMPAIERLQAPRRHRARTVVGVPDVHLDDRRHTVREPLGCRSVET
jgi:hypothetical protein